MTAAGFDQEVVDGGGSDGGRDGLNLYAQEKLAIWRERKDRVSNDVRSKEDAILLLYRRCLDDVTDLEVLEFDAEDGAKGGRAPSKPGQGGAAGRATQEPKFWSTFFFWVVWDFIKTPN